jgi:hypothetical protein
MEQTLVWRNWGEETNKRIDPWMRFLKLLYFTGKLF